MPSQTQLIIATFFVVVGHAAGLSGFYDKYLWFDNLIHFLGGGWIVLVLLLLKNRFLFLEFLTVENSPSKVFKTVIAVLTIGLFWEVFEFSLDLYASAAYGLNSNFQTIDTLLDLALDGIGALLVSFSLFSKKRGA